MEEKNMPKAMKKAIAKQRDFVYNTKTVQQGIMISGER